MEAAEGMKLSWTQLGLAWIGLGSGACASKRVVPRRGDPPSLYGDGGFFAFAGFRWKAG